jgi:hypothetical protein
MAGRPQDTWFVSYETSRLEKRPFARQTETFKTEQEAKQFAKSKLVQTLNITAGTLNPYQPRRTVTSKQVPDWVEESDEARKLPLMKCTLCEHCGWVSENHAHKPWEGVHACNCGGAGAPCPWCNKPDDGGPPDVERRNCELQERSRH